jgi:N-methylhydantoinase B
MSRVDPIMLEMVRQRLVSIAQEAEAVIVRTAYSSTIAEASDFSAAILDAQGRLLAQTPLALGAFIGVLGTALKTLLGHFPADTLMPGDTIVTNDPWIGAGHLPDIVAIRPIFFRNRIVGYAANVAHVSDIGGRVSAESSDMFEEGLLIPPTLLFRGGNPDRVAMRFIQSNSRLPDQVAGDIQALYIANALTERRLGEILVEYGLDDLDDLSEELQTRAERAVRERIRSVPDGVYEGEAYSDGVDKPLRIAARVTISGDRIDVDYAGTAPQVRWGINAPFNLTRAETMYALRLLFAPDVPVVEGAIAPFSVTAPEGCVLNPRRPAATMIRVTVVQNIFGALFSALAGLEPDYVPSGRLHAHFGGIWAIRFRGVYHEVPSVYRNGGPPQVNRSYAEAYFFNGGTGALGCADGRSTLSMPVNCSSIPVEIMEARTPVLFEHKRILPDSGGAGRYRGGLGQEISVRILSDVPIDFVPGTNDRVDHPPFGLFGGKAGSGGGMWIDGTRAHRRRSQTVLKDQIVTVAIPGGGGFGNPLERDPKRIEQDIAAGLVTLDGAARDYGYGEHKKSGLEN